MIPLREQDRIRQVFSQALADEVKIEHFTQREFGLFVPGREPCETCKPSRQLLEELASLTDKITLREYDFAQEREAAAKWGIDKIPGTVVHNAKGRSFKFYGVPAGNEFPAFIDTLIDFSQNSSSLTAETKKQLRKLKRDVRVQVFLTPT